MKLLPFSDSSEITFKGTGVSFDSVANGTKTFIFEIPFDCLVNGCEIISENPIGDSVSIKVLDGENHFGMGVDAELDKFVTDWFICERLTKIETNYAARMKQGFKVVFDYKSTEAKKVYINMKIHKTNKEIQF